MENTIMGFQILSKLINYKNKLHIATIFKYLKANADSKQVFGLEEQNLLYDKNDTFSMTFSKNSSYDPSLSFSEKTSSFFHPNNKKGTSNIDNQTNELSKEIENKTFGIQNQINNSKKISFSEVDLKEETYLDSGVDSMVDSVESVDKIKNLKIHHKKSNFFLPKIIKYSEDDIELNLNRGENSNKNLNKNFSLETLENLKEKIKSKIKNSKEHNNYLIDNNNSEFKG